MEKDLALFNRLVALLLKKEKEEPVAKIIPPNEMYNLLDISLEDAPASEAFFEEVLEKVVLSTPRTASNQFFNQLFGGRISKATLGDLLAVMLNNSMYTFKVAGPQVGIEKEILHKVCNLIGYDNDNDGTFAPGGSMSNYMAMLMARDAFDSKIKNEGVQQKMTLYTSKESHYSIPKNATFMGIGRNQVRYVPSDSYGRMIPEKLEELLIEDLSLGFHPFFCECNSGYNGLRSF
jgi:sulfinoalanine decarboxylase/sulfinoalanine decarboxylase/aspartate 1-decarboxylase